MNVVKSQLSVISVQRDFTEDDSTIETGLNRKMQIILNRGAAVAQLAKAPRAANT